MRWIIAERLVPERSLPSAHFNIAHCINFVATKLAHLQTRAPFQLPSGNSNPAFAWLCPKILHAN